MGERTLTDEEGEALLALLIAIESAPSTVWASIEEHMREEGGIDDPSGALDLARAALEEGA